MHILFITPKGNYSTCLKTQYEGSKAYQGCKKVLEGTFEQCRKELAKIQKGEPDNSEAEAEKARKKAESDAKKTSEFVPPTQDEIDELHAKMSAQGFRKTTLTAPDKAILKWLESQKEAENE